MDDVVCTAVEADSDRPNILFTPPCACPRCAPEQLESADGRIMWLERDGKRVGLELFDMELGTSGKAMLG